MKQTLQQLIYQQDNDYSHFEAEYDKQVGAPLVDDPYTSVLHPLADITLSASIVIPAWNAADSIERVLIAIEQSSFNQKYPDQLEVIVVDDGSLDETWQILEHLDLNIHLKAFHQDNHGRSQARNTAIASSEGDIIICCDSDMILSTFAIEELMKRHQICNQALLLGFRTPVHSEIPAFEPANLRNSLKNLLPMFYGDARINYLFGGWGFCRETNHLKLLGRGKAICRPSGLWRDLLLQVYGCLFSLRRSDFLAMNAYDEGFYGWGYEDLLVGAHAVALGNYIVPVYAATGWHIKHEERSPYSRAYKDITNRKRWNELARNQVYYYQRLHHPFPARNLSWQKQARERVLKTIERHPSRMHTRGEIDASYYNCYKDAFHDLNALGHYNFQVGRYKDAEQVFAAIHGTEREELAAMMMRGRSLRMAGCINEATALLKESTSSQAFCFTREFGEQYAYACIDYALALAAQDRFVEARQQFYRAGEIKPDNLWLQTLIQKPLSFYEEQARIYLRQQDYTHALQAYELALILEPSNLLIQTQRSNILACLGKQEDARRAHQFAIKNVPLENCSENDAALSLAWEYLASGYLEPAKITIEQLLQRYPDNLYLLENLQTLHMEAARTHRVPLANMIIQDIQAIPGVLLPEELIFLITMTMQAIATLRDEEPGLFVDVDSYCGQSIIAMGMALRSMGCNQNRLVSIYRPRQEPVELSPLALPTSREFCLQVLWKYELAEHVLCIPEQSEFPGEQPCRLLLVAGGEDNNNLPADIAHYITALAPGGLVLAHPYNHKHPVVQQWVNELLLNSHYLFLGQVGQLIALQKPPDRVI